MATNDKTDTAEGPNDEGDLVSDPGVARALQTRFGQTRKNSGPEPTALEDIARYVDGDLPADRRATVEARLRAEPELRELVDELAKLERGDGQATTPAEGHAERPSNVIPLVIPAGRAARVGQASVAFGQSGPGTVRALPLAEPKKNPMRTAVIGIGAALAIAAVAFLVMRPPMTTEGTQGAALGDKRDGIAIGFEAGQAVLEVDAVTSGELTVLVATPSGTRAVGLCDAKTCLVTQDRVLLRAGKNSARAVIGGDNGSCAFVLALTANGSPRMAQHRHAVNARRLTSTPTRRPRRWARSYRRTPACSSHSTACGACRARVTSPS